MTAASAPAEETAPPGRPWAHIAADFQACAAGGDHDGLLALMRAKPPVAMPNWAIGQYLQAALAAGDEGAIAAAMERVRTAPLPTVLRARLALALVRHRRAHLAAELLELAVSRLEEAAAPAHPAATPASLQARAALLNTLAALAQDDTAPPALRGWAA